MKFNNFNKIIDFKMFMLIGETWNVKALLNLITFQFKWDFVSPSSLVLLEIYEDQIVNATGQL